jgi:hypothetical protein
MGAWAQNVNNMKRRMVLGILSLLFTSTVFAQEKDILPVKMEETIFEKLALYTQYVHKDTISVYAVKIVIRPPGGFDRIVFSTGAPHRTDSLLQQEFQHIDVDWSQLYDSTDLTGVINIIIPVLKIFDVPSDKTTLNSLSFDMIARIYQNAFTFPAEERKWTKSSTILCKPLIGKQIGFHHH